MTTLKSVLEKWMSDCLGEVIVFDTLGVPGELKELSIEEEKIFRDWLEANSTSCHLEIVRQLALALTHRRKH